MLVSHLYLENQLSISICILYTLPYQMIRSMVEVREQINHEITAYESGLIFSERSTQYLILQSAVVSALFFLILVSLELHPSN